MNMTAIQVPEALHQRAQAAAAQQGESVEALVETFLEEYVEELNDVAEAMEIIGRIKRGEEEAIPWEQVKAELAELERKGELPD